MKTILMYMAFHFAIVGISIAQPTSYDATTIPEALKKNASVVKRYENQVFEITDIDRAKLSIHQVYTVLNENGRHILNFAEYSYSFVSLEDVEIRVYDAKGKQTQRYKKKDLSTSAYGEGLVDDGKYTYMTISAPSYPITVEYIYEVRFKGTLHYPRYEIIVPEEGVEKSSFTAKVPKDLDLRFKPSNTNIKPEITDDGKSKSYKWSVSNLAPIEYEQGAVTYRKRYPSIELAPNKFKMDDYDGDMSTWKSFGNWYNVLTKNLDVLPENRKAFYKDLVKDAKNDREKAKLIYEYLQQNFRYVSIQLGIGGFKPFPATFTDQKKYGDCKGLSNYTQAALSAVGIKSYQALIYRETFGSVVEPDFPCNAFNHVILFLPDNKDTIWLECTSRTLEFGKLDISTQNRYALLVTENGGQIIATPTSKAEENLFSSKSTITLDNTGRGNIVTTLATSGEYKEEVNEYLFEESRDNQKKYLIYRLGYKQPDEFSIEKLSSSGPLHTRITMEVEKVPEFAAGTKMFITPRIYKLSPSKLPKAENRTQDFYFGCPFTKIDTTVFILPEGFIVDVLPKEKEMKCDLANYSSKYWYDEKARSVYSTAKIVMNQQRIPVARFSEIKQFIDDVVADDGQRIVIKKE